MADIAVVGTPGPFAVWTFQFLQATLPHIFPDLQIIALDRLDEVPPCPADAHRLILSNFPPNALAAHCRAGLAKPLLLLNDVAADLAFIQASHGIPALDAIRSLSGSLAMLGPIATAPECRVVRATDGLRLLDFLIAFKAFGLAAAEVERIAKACTPFGGVLRPIEEAVAAWSASHETCPVGKDDLQLATAVLGGLVRYLTSGEAGEIVWPTSSFYNGDRPGETAPVTLDVTGRARIIFYGPYFHLLRGDWALNLMMGFSENISGLPLSIQIASRSLLGEARVLAKDDGIYALDRTLHVTDPVEPIEIRVMSDQGAIEGRIALVRATFTPMAID